MNASFRQIAAVFPAMPTQDGAGVSLKRALGQSDRQRMDPYLMMDVFFSSDPKDYLAGFPSHPHRGFETITYMLEGNMLHEDHAGHRGELKTGGIQWMTAGKGIIHSEMPQQVDGAMRGFQIWLNLPSAEKMKAPAYQNIEAANLPKVPLAQGGEITLIAGQLELGGMRYQSPVQASATRPLIADIRLEAGETVELPISEELNALLFLFEGEAEVEGKKLNFDQSALLTAGNALRLKAGERGGRAMLLAGKPLNEPVVQYGPFVMNSVEEIRQAIDDYNSGRFVG
ncbi:pirin family protein [Leminorella grimontii]|uniref:pirin family protein n=1 Tax=Leminorella grimontii TaxID=82981 RepID=UPI00321FD540